MNHYPLIDAHSRFDAVVVANGLFPSSPLPLSLLSNTPVVCCCDGAVESVLRQGVEPTFIVGDGDSLSSALQERYRHILHLESEQEDNDLTKATRFLSRRGLRRMLYLGATGLREDHTLGNISLLVRYLRDMALEPVMVSDEGVMRPAFGPSSWQSRAGQQVSVFNVSSTRLSSQGLRYPLYPFKELWQGTLNEALSTSFQIDADGYYLLWCGRTE